MILNKKMLQNYIDKNGKLITHHQKVNLFAFLFCDPKYEKDD